MTAEEVLSLVAEHGVEETARRVDVVTTGTFGPMCSSGAFFNVGHTTPRMRMSKVTLNGVSAYAGLAAVDVYLGATEIPETDPANSNYPGEFNYGGAHVIEDLVAANLCCWRLNLMVLTAIRELRYKGNYPGGNE